MVDETWEMPDDRSIEVERIDDDYDAKCDNATCPERAALVVRVGDWTCAMLCVPCLRELARQATSAP